MKYRDDAEKILEFKMDPKEKAAWVAALRSGKFGQANGKLFDGKSGYCCLGVKCKIDGNLKQQPDGRYTDSTIKWDEPNYFGSYINVKTIPNPIQDKLAMFNDNGKSFNWIAKYIERYL